MTAPIWRRVVASTLLAMALVVPLAGPVSADDPSDPSQFGYFTDQTFQTTVAPEGDIEGWGFSETASEDNTAAFEAAYVTDFPTKTYNRAGRPITGISTGNDADGWCQGIGYGRVNTKLVLFTAAHCYVDYAPTSVDGDPGTSAANGVVYNIQPGRGVLEDGSGLYLGTIGEIPYGAAVRDFGYIILASGVRPSDLSRVFRDVDSNNDKRWRTTTLAKPPSSLSCSGLLNSGDYNNGSGLYMNWQSTLDSVYANRTGDMVGWWTANGVRGGSTTACSVMSTVLNHNTNNYKDSGSSTYRAGEGRIPTFIGSGRYNNSSGTLYNIFTPVYGGLAALNAYWTTHGYQVGAWFCWSPSCPSTDPTP